MFLTGKAAAAAAAAAALILFTLLFRAQWLGGIYTNYFQVAQGDFLVYGVPGKSMVMPGDGQTNKALVMPSVPLAYSLAAGKHGSWVSPVFMASLLLLVFALAAELHSWPAGLAACAAVLAAFTRDPGNQLLNLAGVSADPEQVIFSGALLCVAWLLALSKGRSSLFAAILTGAAIGASLYIRTALAFFPLVLGLFRAARQPGPRLRAFFSAPVLALLLTPLAILAMRVPYTYYFERDLVLLEGARSDSNMIAGALGLTGTMEGDAFKLAGITSGRDSVARWAAAEIVRHPVRYAGAVLKRLKFALSLSPLIVFLAALAFFRFRKDPAFAELLLLCAYFTGIHCLMAVEERYFMPLYALLIPVAACSLDYAVPGLKRTGGAFISKAAALVSAVPQAALFIAALALTVMFPYRARTEFSFASERNADSAAVLRKKGEFHLRRGEAAEAELALGRALLLEPSIETESAYFNALIAKGLRPPAGYWLRMDRRLEYNLHALFYALAKEDLKAARPAYAAAYGVWMNNSAMIRNPDSAYAVGLMQKLRAGDPGFIESMKAAAEPFPPAISSRILRGLWKISGKPEYLPPLPAANVYPGPPAPRG
ncbi:MAG TPA: hypothetical protein PKI19_06675 [Elusimicrobiales bacterium]|nr:hypothetical protein [Elusimicrobiales bacterium]